MLVHFGLIGRVEVLPAIDNKVILMLLIKNWGHYP